MPVMHLLLWGLALGAAIAHGQKVLRQEHLGTELRTKLRPVDEHISVPRSTQTQQPLQSRTLAQHRHGTALRGTLSSGLPRHGVDNLTTLGTGLEAPVKHGPPQFLHPAALLESKGSESAAGTEKDKRRPQPVAASPSSAKSTDEASGKPHPNSTALDEEEKEEEEEWTLIDHAAFAMLVMTRTFLVVALVLVAVFCYCCGIGDDLILCCGVFAGFKFKTKMQMVFFLLLNVAAFLAVWQVKLLRPVLYIFIVFAVHGIFCCGCIVVIVMELSREARRHFREGVEFLGYLDDKVDDMLDYLGLSEASSDDDVATTCWGTPVRRAEKKAPEPPKIEEVKEQPSRSCCAWTQALEEKEEPTKTNGRPLVGTRQSKQKKPRAGKAKTVK